MKNVFEQADDLGEAGHQGLGVAERIFGDLFQLVYFIKDEYQLDTFDAQVAGLARLEVAQVSESRHEFEQVVFGSVGVIALELDRTAARCGAGGAVFAGQAERHGDIEAGQGDFGRFAAALAFGRNRFRCR